MSTDDLVRRLRDKTRLRKHFGLTGIVLHEEALTDEAADTIERLQRELEGQAKTTEALRGLLGVADCPNCDGSGGVLYQVGSGECEMEQCGWCYKRFMLTEAEPKETT